MVHVVRRGENLSEIARAYGVLPSAIVAANVLRNPRHVEVGQKLQIPKEYTTELNGKRINSDVMSFATQVGPVAPFRPIMEGVGADVKWKADSRTVTSQTRNKSIQFRIGEREALINGDRLMMDLAAFLTRGRTMVPVTFFRQALDATVTVDPDSGRIFITSP
jgi:LysM repeat protein